MEKKTVYIHIGSDKTGSTAIQKFAFLNIGMLKAGGLHVVSSKFDHHGPLCDALKAQDIDVINKTLSEIASEDSPKFLITFEGFYHLSGNDLIRFLNLFSNFNLKIIFYVRRRSDLLRSGVAQNLKINKRDNGAAACEVLFDKNFERIAASPNFNYLAVVRRWQEALGLVGKPADCFKLRVYENTSLILGDLIADFFSIINICEPEKIMEGGGFVRPQGTVNPSISPAAQYILALIFMLDVDDKKRNAIRNIIIGCDSLEGRNESLVPDELAIKLDNHYAAQDIILAQEFYGRNQLFLTGPKFCYREPSAQSFMNLIDGIYRKKRVEML